MTSYFWIIILVVCAKMKCFTVQSFLFLLFLSSIAANEEGIINEEEIIKSVNQKQSTWIAGRNFPSSVKLEDLRRRNGEIELPTPLKLKVHKIPEQDIIESFDARAKWPFCSDVISTIRNQGICGSCWAFAATSTMSDRLCIQSKGAIKFQFSPEDLLECCGDYCGYGCGGGNSFRAWNYWTKHGIVSGGDYLSQEGCKPYSDEPFVFGVTPRCTSKCANTNFTVSYNSDKRFGKTSYQVAADVRQMQYEIMTNGPIQVTYTVYEDFYYYKSGVYQHVTGNSTGLHSVRIIGWGKENGVPYWLVANSWGEEWGDLEGFFKILRGKNHCGIENKAAAGTPGGRPNGTSRGPETIRELILFSTLLVTIVRCIITQQI